MQRVHAIHFSAWHFVAMFLCLFIHTIIPAAAQKGKVEGYVQDASFDKPLQGANIVLLSAKDSLQVSGTTSDEQGYYSFQNVSGGNYLIVVLFIGYENVYSDVFTVSDTKVIVPNLSMQSAVTELEGVEIKTVKDRYEVFSDKIVLNVENSISAATTNAFDLLKKAPGVAIDQEDNIKLNGAAGVRIQFDGRDINLPWSAIVNILKTMPTSAIGKIEVMSNPSAKYDAEGTAGIINICFKVEKQVGWSGSIGSWVNNNKVWSVGGDATVNYVGPKSTIYASYGYSQWNNKSSVRAQTDSQRPLGDTIRRITTEEGGNFYTSHLLRVGYDYKLNTKQTLGASIHFGKDGWGALSTMRPTYLYHSGNGYTTPDSCYFENLDISMKNNNVSVNLNFTHQFDTTGKKLTLNLDGTLYENTMALNVENRYFSSMVATVPRLHEAMKQKTPSDSYILVFRGDYTHPFNETFRMEVGLKNGLVYNDNTFEGTILQADNSWLADTNRNNHFQYTEDILAAYVMLSKTFSLKFSLSGGLRAEQTFVHGNQITTKEVFSKNYLNIFPNVNISYSITPRNMFSLSYSYRIDRPDYSELNPFIFKGNEYEYRKGNIDLEPAFSHNLTLNYTWNYSVFATVTYGYSDGNTMRNISYDPSTLRMVTYPDNMASSQMVNLSLSTRQSIFSWWTFFITGGASYGSNKALSQGKTVETSLWVYNLFGNSSFILPKKWTIELSGYYQSGFVWGISRADGYRGMSVGVKKTLWNDKLDIRLTVNGLFDNETFHMISNYPHMRMERWMQHNQLMVGLNATLRFGNHNQQPDRSDRDLDEINRLGNSGGQSVTPQGRP